MTRRWSVASGLGAAVTTTAAAAAVASRRRRADQLDGESLGDLAADRYSTVAADDGTPLSVAEIDPESGDVPEVTVVGVHGFALSKRAWHFQRREFAELAQPAVRQVYYDHRGHGTSGAASAADSTIATLADDLAAVLRALAPTGPIVLMGHSLGGMVIMELARTRPRLFDGNRVRGVVLVATAAGRLTESGVARGMLSRYNPLTRGVGGLAHWQPGLVEFVRAASGGLTRQAVRTLAFGSRDVDSRLVDLILDLLSVTPVGELTNFVETLSSHDRYDALAGFGDTRVLVVGGDTDRITPYHHAESIADACADGKLLRVRGAGHMAHWEQAELVNSHLVELLRRCVPGTNGGQTTRRTRWWRR